jgi:hypothetical protein
MTKKQVLFQRIVSADGKNIAEAIAFTNNDSTTIQSITVTISSDRTSSSSSSSSSSNSQQTPLKIEIK